LYAGSALFEFELLQSKRYSSYVQTIVTLQFLRAFAAIGVVVSHFQWQLARSTGTETLYPSLRLGNSGVDLFFVISGFVMVYASERLFSQHGAAVSFFSHRLIRIVPLYWLAIAIYVSISAVIPGFERNYPPSAIIESLFFIPYSYDGSVMPIVSQGWTLNYEMLFYAIFAVAVLLPRRTAVLAASSTLIALVLAGFIFAPKAVALEFWSEPIILEFGFGIIIAAAYREGVRLPANVSLAVMIVGAALLLILIHVIPSDTQMRVITWGIPGAFIVAGATLCDFSPSGMLARALATLGDASYALYVFHFFPVAVVIAFAKWSRLDVSSTFWPLMGAALTAAITCAIAIHFLFERPITRVLRTAVARGSPQTVTR
jgi:exopolysaccharide production protein ExoZ